MRAFAIATACAFAACSSRPVARDAGEVPLGELPGRIVAAACACLVGPDGGRYCSLADCEEAFPELGLATLDAEVDGGLLAYDPHAAASCLADAGAFCFASPLFYPPSIELILEQSCPEALLARRGLGQSCLTDLDCDAGVCAPGTSGCAGSCTAPLAAGSPCAVGGVPCAGGLSCLGGRCAGTPNTGDPCHTLGSAGECGGALWCNLDAGVCEVWARAGQACEWHGGALAPPCAAPNWCSEWNQVGRCESPSDAGGPCLTLDDGNDCTPPSTCLLSDAGPGFGMCGPPVGAGGACAGFGCASGLACVKNRCIPLSSDGGCLSLGAFGPLSGVAIQDQCPGSFVCGTYDAGDFCGAPVCLGGSCAVGAGACADGVCRGGTCGTPALGSPCRVDADCPSDDCVDGGCADPYACAP